MNRLDAVASESYQLQSVIIESEATETKEPEQPLIDASLPASIQQTLSRQTDERKSETVAPSDNSPTLNSLKELQSEDEDKFSDFDPSTLPEEESETCPHTTSDTVPPPNSADNQGNQGKKGLERTHTDDYMSDVSSGEDFLSAAHDHSGPEDGEYSEGDDTPKVKQCDNKLPEESVLDTPSDQTDQTKLVSLQEQIKGQVEDNEKEDCETATFPSGEEKPQVQSSISNLLVDNASPINDEDLDSLDDFEHSDIITTENSSKVSESAIENSDKNSTNLPKEDRVEKDEVDNCEEVKKGDKSDSYSHLNPEPIDSSPDILTCWGGDKDEDIPHESDSQLTSVECKNSSKVEGKPGLG